MTAALINPPGVVSGSVDATGCNVGGYYEGGHRARLSNADVFSSNCNPSPVPTNISVTGNVIYGDLCFNQSYQAGIADVGNRDKMINNAIYGPGYTACATGTTIDVSDATDPTVRNAVRRVPRPHPDRDGDGRDR